MPGASSTRTRFPLHRRALTALAQVGRELFPPAERRVEDRVVVAPGVEPWQSDAADRYCHRCGASSGRGGFTHRGCARCLKQRLPWDRLVRLSGYAPPMSDWVVAAKFCGCWSWSQWMGLQLAEAVRPWVTQADRTIICPMPMHTLRRVRRGYNQSQLMAEALAAAGPWRCAQLLKRTRYTRPQTQAPPSRREENIRDSFGIAPVDLTGYQVWLVDDVKTTGSSLIAGAKLLRDAGAQVHAAVAAVRDPAGEMFHTL